jgi:hypothetical protein
MERTTATPPPLPFVAAMVARMTTTAEALRAWASAAPRTLAEVEQQALVAAQGLGNALLAGVCEVLAATTAEPEVARPHPCACGHPVTVGHQRRAQVTTLLGPIVLTRAYYSCPHCHRGHAPLDRQLGYRAGSTSAGLDELLALLGATVDSFAAASRLLERLTLVHVCPNLARAATETLGQVLQATEQQAVSAAWEAGTVPTAVATPPRLCLSMDGVMVHTEEGWREYKLGSVYTTATRPSTTHPGREEVYARDVSYVGDVTDAATFGQHLWCEAARRGVLTAQEVVIVADGAHWIWDLAAEHFAEATQIVDWYHATHYLWQAAHAVYGEGTPLAKRWAKRRLAELWAGQVPKVLKALGKQPQHAAVQEALTYYTNHQQRMCYADYRARGLPIGSGTMESGCKQIVTARLKQAGMIWSLAGARAVAAVRTWLKSDRWHEAVALRPPPQRTYQRRAA